MFKLVDTVQTKVSDLDLCKALIEVWFEQYKVVPSKSSIGIIVSQKKLETGDKYIWNFNIGNSKVGQDIPGQEIKYMMLKGVWEIENGKRVVYEPPNRQTWFRAFDSLTDGVRHHFDLLKNKRYKTAWEAVEKGDVVLFATRLKAAGYFTAPVQDYVNGMLAIYKNYDKSGNYEKALSEFQKSQEPPPLNPPIEITPQEPEMGELTPIEEPKVEPPKEPENKNGFMSVLFNFFTDFLKWFQRK